MDAKALELEHELRQLEARDRLEEAARLADEHGLYERASQLWERACDYEHAARAALEAQDAARALTLAVRAGSLELESASIDRLRAEPEHAVGLSQRLITAGQIESAARLELSLGNPARGATLFERAGAWISAAEAYVKAGDSRNASRCLQVAIQLDDAQHLARLKLGGLLMKNDRVLDAIRFLQKIPEGRPERPQAQLLLKQGFERLGWSTAALLMEAQLKARPETLPEESADLQEASTGVAEGQGSMLFGRYRVLRTVATTPTASVYHAIDSLTHQEVAVKIFSSATVREVGRDALQRFEREARALGLLRHPCIVALLDYVASGPAVVLQWMAGGNMTEFVAQGPVAPARVLEIAVSVLSGLAEAHRRGILHRDIKPSNVLLDAAGAARLADFGACHLADAAATVTAGVLGTLEYMAPEQLRGEPATVRSDIHGVGALVWHGLTGAPPGHRLPFLSSRLTERHAALLQRFLGPAQDRPSDCAQARQELLGLVWPGEVPPALAAEPSGTTPETALQSERLRPIGKDTYCDTLLGREVVVLKADADTLPRAAAFARADHPGLACVLCFRPDASCVWIEAARGPQLDRPVTSDEAAELAQALSALHRAGGVHGSVDRNHVRWHGERWVLLFPLEPQAGSAQEDLERLRRLTDD